RRRPRSGVNANRHPMKPRRNLTREAPHVAVAFQLDRRPIGEVRHELDALCTAQPALDCSLAGRTRFDRNLGPLSSTPCDRIVTCSRFEMRIARLRYRALGTPHTRSASVRPTLASIAARGAIHTVPSIAPHPSVWPNALPW